MCGGKVTGECTSTAPERQIGLLMAGVSEDAA
jgi:hypothetical protein